MVNRLLAVFVLLLLSPWAIANQLTAQVDRFEIGIDESVELVITLADSSGQRPDLTELYKDFSIDQHGQSSNFTVINGIRSVQIRWTLLLSPNRKGKLTIPAFKVGNLSTDPIVITVGDNPVAQSTSDDLLMEVEVRPLHPYIQGQVIYIQRLYYSRPLVDNASISRPKISKGEADIEYLGASNPRYVTHNGRPYQLIERYYAAFPKKAGALHFEPSVFRGSLASSSARKNRYSMPMFNSGTRVNAYSAKAELTISDKPAGFTGDAWLPASHVNLNMNWSIPPESLKAGEPVIVTIALMAEGIKAESLPEVKLVLPDNLKVYPEQPTFRSDKGGNGLVGLREEKFTVIGNEAGEYQIPAVEVPWWNTNTDKQEVAKLDGFTIKVDGSAVASRPVEPKLSELVTAEKEPVKETPPEKPSEEAKEVSTLIQPVAAKTISELYLENKVVILTGSATFMALLGGLYFWRRRSGLQSEVESQQDKLEYARTRLISACRAGDSRQVMTLLPVWAGEVGIYPSTLAGIESSEYPQLREAVRELISNNYSQLDTGWDGKGLINAVNEFTADQSSTTEPNLLSPLHPIS